MVSVAREMGIPSQLVEATGIKWTQDRAKNTKGPFEGHVFVKMYFNNHWWLVDSTTGDYIIDYDLANPMIPIPHGTQTEGYYVIRKGRDTWDYGVKSLADLEKLQIDFAKETDLTKISHPKYKIGRF